MAYESQTDKDRSLSVYAGVDVFGRGAFGGGEMKSFLARLSYFNEISLLKFTIIRSISQNRVI